MEQKLKKVELETRIKNLEAEPAKVQKEKEIVERDFRTYKALKEGRIGAGAVKNSKA